MEIMSIEDLEKYLKMSKSAIYKKTMDNRIPFIKAGRRLLFSKEAIDLWLEQFVHPTAEEVKSNCVNILKSRKNGSN